MAVTYGFYDAVDGDRVYNAEEMGSMFDGVINDGILPDYESALEVSASDPAALSVRVAKGRAWFDHTWTYNNAILTLEISTPHTTYPRIDIVVLETDKTTRTNSIKVIAGTAGSEPVAPTPTRTTMVNQYVLARVTVSAGVAAIAESSITDTRGTEGCPYASIVEHLEGRMVTSFNGQTGDITYIPEVDSALNENSTSPVQNRVVTANLNTKENTSNKVTSISASSTNMQYPSAKLVYNQLAAKVGRDSPTLTGTPTAPTAPSGTNTTQIATTAFVMTQVTYCDDLAPHVGYTIFDRETMTTSALAKPFFKQPRVNETYPMGYGKTGAALSDRNYSWSIIFKYKNCAGHKIRITWHTDRTVTHTGSTSSTNRGLSFYWHEALYHPLLPQSMYEQSSVVLQYGRSTELEWGDLCGSRAYDSGSDTTTYTYGSVVANEVRTNTFDIPSEAYNDSWLYGELYISAPTAQAIGDDRYIGVYIDKIEIVS